MLVLTTTLAALLTTGVEDCKSTCSSRGNQCRVTCRSQSLRELCFTVCKNDETDCKADCALGVDPQKQRGAQGLSVPKLETDCASGNGKACINAGIAWFVGRDGVKDEGKAGQLFQAGCGRREADACAVVGDLTLDGRALPKNIPLGLDSLEKACQWGSPLGCYQLARTWETGRAGPTDLSKAKKLYVEACAAEFGPACFALGNLLSQKGPMEDAEKAATYTERACDLDDAAACDALCVQTRRPAGAPRDELLSLSFCGKACNGQVMSACTAQALMLLKGPPFRPNPRRARELLDAACDGTDAPACMVLGEALERGRYGWKKSVDDSKRAYERAALIVESPCRKGDAAACATAALLSAEGKGGLAPRPDVRARLEPICGPQDASGCAALGLAWTLETFGPPSPTKALTALQLGCQSKQVAACRRLAHLLEVGGEGVPADPASAGTLYDGACEENDAAACHGLARLLLKGEGVAKDVKRGKALAKKACKLGLKEACR